MTIGAPPVNSNVEGEDKQFETGWKRWISQLQSILVNRVQNFNVSNFQTPSSGFVIQLDNNSGMLLLDPAGALASGTITLPLNPIDQQRVEVSSTKAITVLTINAVGQTVTNAPTTLAAGTGFTYYYRLANKTWYRINT